MALERGLERPGRDLKQAAVSTELEATSSAKAGISSGWDPGSTATGEGKGQGMLTQGLLGGHLGAGDT